MKRKLLVLLLAFVLILSLAACNKKPAETSTGGPATSGGASEPAEITVVFYALPTGLCPITEDDSSNMSICYHIYDRLVTFDADNNMSAGIAKSWKQVDGLTWEFDIGLDNYVFQNGDKLTMDDLVYSIMRLKDIPKSADTGALINSASYSGNTLTLKFTEENNSLLTRVLTTAIIVNKAYMEANGDSAQFVNPIGTGPYKKTEFIPGASVVLETWDGYLLAKPQITKISCLGIGESANRYIAVETGQAQFTGMLTAYEIDLAEKNDNIYIIEKSSRRPSSICFNCEREPFSNVNVRIALTHAIDSEKICALEGGRPPVKSMLFSGWPDYYMDPAYMPEFDLAKAKEMLEAEGYNASNPLHLTISTYIPSDPGLELYQSSLKSIGVEVDLNIVEFMVYLELEGAGDFDMLWVMLLSRGGTPFSDLDRFDYNFVGTRDVSRYYNARVQEIVDEMRVCYDDAKIKALTQEINDILGQEVPMPAMFLSPVLCVADKKLNGVVVNGDMLLNFRFATYTA